MTTTHSPSGPVDALRGFLGVPLRAQTYRNLAYLALAFPLGLVYFVGLSVGLSTGIGLTVTLVGLPLLLVTVLAAAAAAGFEARLATWLVGVDATPPAALGDLDGAFESVDGFIEATKRLLTAPTTWTGVLLVALKFAFGVVAFTALVSATAVAGTLLAAPFLYDAAGISYSVGPYAIETLGAALATTGLGVLVTLVSLHLLNGLAKLGGFTTAVLLGDDPTESETTPDGA
ncbi:sensor domain-containing protein [Halorarius halobius]|uniref:sensor domain-containing protein n=1 Tax=Halorarius halobius TaxID=2962671 RepID=UPI0020CE7F7D|nr:sensor domain-containing protein [Halorarius halobius]